MQVWLSLGVMVLVGVLGMLPSEAVTIAAATCSDTDVQAAINSATSPADIVTVPAGNCTWNTTVVIDTKGLLLQGAGIGQTNITDNGDQNAALYVNNINASTFVRVTGFTWIQQKVHGSTGILLIVGVQGQQAFRFDHNRILITLGPSARGIHVVGSYGLIDHNVMDCTTMSGSVQMITIEGSHGGNDGGHTPWSQPLALGTNQAVYVEDNVITYGSEDEDMMDAYTGARIVFRHNTVFNAAIGFHGTDTGGLRSLFSIEKYRNTFTNNGTKARNGMKYRGGRGSCGTIPMGAPSAMISIS